VYRLDVRRHSNADLRLKGLCSAAPLRESGELAQFLNIGILEADCSLNSKWLRVSSAHTMRKSAILQIPYSRELRGAMGSRDLDMSKS